MANKHVDLTGTLRGGILGPGGETTGYILELPDIDVDMSGIKEPPHADGSVVVAGEMQTRTYPVRGRVTTLHASATAPSPVQLSKAGQRASIILQGTLRTGVIRPGSEGPPYSLSATPEVDTSKIKPGEFLNKQVRVSGGFASKHYVTLGLRFIFEATAIKLVEDHATAPVEPPPPVATPGKISAIGTSDNLSYDEAMHDAIAQLQKLAPQIPDFLLDISVDAVSAQVGGIAGLHRLHITVSAPIPNK